MLVVVDTEKLTADRRIHGWKNIYITTAGSFIYALTHATEVIARDYSDTFFAEWQEYIELGGEEPVDLPDGSTLPFSEFKCAFQVPVIN